MRPEDIIRLLRRQPFQPFRVWLTDGTHYDVEGTEFAIVDCSAVHIGFPGPEGLQGPVERIIDVALLHIVRTTVLERSATRRRRSNG